MGLGLNTTSMQAFLPTDKLLAYRAELDFWQARHKITLRELKSLIGKLQFATAVILPGKAFLRRLHDLTIGVKKPMYFIRITKGTRQDLAMWAAFLDNYNGITIIREPSHGDSRRLHMYSDASKLGFGATFGSQWIQAKWPQSWAHLNIAILELYPIYVLVSMFAHKLKNTYVTFHCDNMAVVLIIKGQTSRDKTIMSIVRPLVLELLTANLHLTADHIPGIENVLADAISRFQVSEKLLRQYGMRSSCTPLPAHLLPQNFPLLLDGC